MWNVTRERNSMSLKSKVRPMFVKDNYICRVNHEASSAQPVKNRTARAKVGSYLRGQNPSHGKKFTRNQGNPKLC
jgi:hypothetical protein